MTQEAGPSFCIETCEQKDDNGSMVKFLLITANVGSLFEESCKIQDGWMQEILKRIRKADAQFLAMHMQEVGGKEFEKCMCQVHEFITKFQASYQHFGFTGGCAFLDQNFESPNQFTALGSLYLCHESLSGQTGVWNFSQEVFASVKSFEIHGGDLSDNPFVEKFRFQSNFVADLDPIYAFTRKGFMKIRWHVCDLVVDFVNLHLFHDGCNLTAIETPTRYAAFRKKGITAMLRRLSEDGTARKALAYRNLAVDGLTDRVPTFLFGDFNFRLEQRSFVERLTGKDTEVRRLSMSPVPAKGNKRQSLEEELTGGFKDLTSGGNTQDISVKINRKKSGECLLRLEKKGFDYYDHPSLSTNWISYRGDDKELKNFPELFEVPVAFAPTYPWTEDASEPQGYMKTRAPAWCDRVVMNGEAWRLISPETARYGSVGKSVCMGDHKPVYLAVSIAVNCNDIAERLQRPLSEAECNSDQVFLLKRPMGKSPLTCVHSSPGKLANKTHKSVDQAAAEDFYK